MKPNPVNRKLARILRDLKSLAARAGAEHRVTCSPGHTDLFGKSWQVQVLISTRSLSSYMILTFSLSNPKSWEYTKRRASLRGSGIYRLGGTVRRFKSIPSALRYARAAFISLES